MEALAPVIGFIETRANLAYAVVFILAFSEAIPFVGAVVPGSVLVIAAAALIPTGAVRMWPLMAAAVAGALLGDGLSYSLGRRYGRAILDRPPFRHYPELIGRSQSFVARHGGRGVLLARFTPGLRALVPMMAGMLGMPVIRFWPVNVLAALAWATAHVLPGMLLGASARLAGAAAGRLMLLLALLVILGWLIVAGVRLALRRGPAVLAAGEARLRAWACAHEGWLARQLRTLIDPQSSELRALLIWAAVVMTAAGVFVGVLEDVVRGDPLIQLDTAVYNALQGIRSPAGDAVMIAITELGDPVVTISLTLSVFLWLASQRAWRTGLYWLSAVGFAALLNTVIKLIIQRARPGDLGYLGPGVFSFPSGHATVNAVIWGLLAFFVARGLRPAWRFFVFTAATTLAVLVAFSRLYLGAHWFSDVVASFAFAAAWVIVLALAYAHRSKRPFDHRHLAAVACTVLVVVGGLNILRNHAADTQRYAVRTDVPTIAAAAWWNGGWRELPAYRTDLTGEREEPLTVQWAGTLDGLTQQLLAAGWQQPVPWTLAGGLSWLASTDPAGLPVIPTLESGRPPDLTLIRVAGEKARFVVRLWPADRRIVNGRSYPLWLGSVVEERLARPLTLISLTRATPQVEHALTVLARSLPGGRLADRNIDMANWSGRVLLAMEEPSPAGRLAE